MRSLPPGLSLRWGECRQVRARLEDRSFQEVLLEMRRKAGLRRLQCFNQLQSGRRRRSLPRWVRVQLQEELQSHGGQNGLRDQQGTGSMWSWLHRGCLHCDSCRDRSGGGGAPGAVLQAATFEHRRADVP